VNLRPAAPVGLETLERPLADELERLAALAARRGALDVAREAAELAAEIRRRRARKAAA
jgi:hypothetical protein